MQAEARLQVSSAQREDGDASEERDNVREAQQAEEEIRSRNSSSKSSSSSSGSGRGRLRQWRAAAGMAAVGAGPLAAAAFATGSSTGVAGASCADVRSTSSSNTSTVSPVVQELMDEAARSQELHANEVALLESKLQDAIAREKAKIKQADDQEAKIAALEASRQDDRAEQEELQERLEEANIARNQVAIDLGNAQDRIVGLDARYSQTIRNLKEEHDLQKKQQGARHKREVDRIAEEEVLSHEQNVDLFAELAMSTEAHSAASDERDKLHSFIQHMQGRHKITMDFVQELLVSADAALTGTTGSEEAPQDESLLQQLEISEERNRAAIEALAKLRQDILSIDTTNLDKEREMQVVLEEVDKDLAARSADVVAVASQRSSAPSFSSSSSSSSSSSAQGPPRRPSKGVTAPKVDGGRGGGVARGRGSKGGRRGPFGSGAGHGLSVIREVEDEDAASQVSQSDILSVKGAADEDIGDLGDFEEGPKKAEVGMGVAERARLEDLVHELESEVAESQSRQRELKEEAAGDAAQSKSYIGRLKQLLATSREGHSDVAKELRDLRKVVVEEDKQHASVVEEMRTEMDTAREELAREVKDRRSKGIKQDKIFEGMQTQLLCAIEGRRVAESRVNELKLVMASNEAEQQYTIGRLQTQLYFSEGMGDEPPDVAQQVAELKEALDKCVEERNLLQNDLEVKEVHWQSVIDEMQRDQASEMACLQKRHQQEVTDLRSKLQGEIKELQTEVARLRDLCGQAQDASWKVVCSFPGSLAFRCGLGDDCTIHEATAAARDVCGPAAAKGASLAQLSGEMWAESGLNEAWREAAGGGEAPPCIKFHQLGRGHFDFSRAGSGRAITNVVAVSYPPSSRDDGDLGLLVVLHSGLWEPQEGRSSALG